MPFHRNAKLGLAGRYALVSAITEGMTLKAAAAAFNVSPATAHRWWHRWQDGERRGAGDTVVSVRSLEPSAPLAAAARARARRRRSAPVAARRAGGRAWSPARPASPLDRLEGAPAGRASRGRRGRARAGQPLRVALPRRPAAHGHQRVRPLPTARPPRHRRPAKPGPPPPRRHRHRARDRRRPLPARLRRDPRRPASCHRRRLPRARARLLRRHGITAKRLITDNGWQLHQAAATCTDCSADTGSGTSPPSPTGHAPTARSNASTKRWRASGPTGSSTTHTANAPPPCHTGSTTTTRGDHTAHSEADPQSAAFTTSVGRTSRSPGVQARRHLAWDGRARARRIRSPLGRSGSGLYLFGSRWSAERRVTPRVGLGR